MNLTERGDNTAIHVKFYTTLSFTIKHETVVLQRSVLLFRVAVKAGLTLFESLSETYAKRFHVYPLNRFFAYWRPTWCYVPSAIYLLPFEHARKPAHSSLP